MKSSARTLVRYFSAQKASLALSVFLSLVQALSLVPVALLIQRVFDSALPHRDAFALTQDLGLVLVLFGVNALATLWNRQAVLTLVKEGVHKLRMDLLGRALFFSRQWYAREDVDALHTKIVLDTARIDVMVSAFMSQFLPGVLVSLGLSCVLAYENLTLFVLVAIVLPVLYALGKLVGRRVRAFTKAHHRTFATFSKSVLFALTFNELIRISAAEKIEQERQDAHARGVWSSGFGMAWWGAAYGVIQSNVLIFVGMLVLFVGGLAVISGEATIGSLLSFYVALNLLTSNARTSLASIPTLIEGSESAATIVPILAYAQPQGGTSEYPGLAREIVFENVHFTYPETSEGVTGVSFRVKKGQLFGIAGASGSGKSTLVQLLLGFYVPQKGSVTFDGVPVHEFEGSSYRTCIGVVPQNPQLFSGTIRENLTYGLEGVTDEQLESVATLCSIHDYVASLPEGYDTDIGQLGAKLSGGQRQRLALVRALLRNPELLILDEPDNNLDAGMFLEILERIKVLPLTTVMVSHNRELLARADEVFELP